MTVSMQDDTLRLALQRIADGDVPRPVGEFYFPDKRVSKHNKCAHGAWMYDDCGYCIEAFAAAVIAEPVHPQAPEIDVERWQPIGTAPKDGAKLLLCDGPEDVVYIGYWEADIYAPNGGSGGPSGWFADNWMDSHGDSPVIEFPVYWQPLPASPNVAALSSLGGELRQQEQGVGDCATRTAATHEPSPTSGLGPSGECQTIAGDA